jgi:hypothetical protein
MFERPRAGARPIGIMGLLRSRLARVARELERRVVELVVSVLGARVLPTPSWLVRPGRIECAGRWPLVREIYAELEPRLELPDAMRPVERREIDAVIEADGSTRLLEVDETQHFNRFRAQTLRRYADDVSLAFDAWSWIARCEQKLRLEGGGFGRPKPPLFPGENGRHRQRAFRDALADLVPLEHGYGPTLRVADFEVAGWLHESDAEDRMTVLITEKLASSR